MIPVRQVRVLPPSSFRFRLTADTLDFGCILPTAGRIRDFHPLERALAGRTAKRRPPTGPSVYSAEPIRRNRVVHPENVGMGKVQHISRVVHGLDKLRAIYITQLMKMENRSSIENVRRKVDLQQKRKHSLGQQVSPLQWRFQSQR